MQTLVFSWMLMLSALTGAVSNFPVDMFETTSHNFGTVVRGSKTEFDFIFTNRYAEDVVIESVTSSCQCTTPSFGPRGPIRTGERGRVHISINTQNFTGNKNATITVRFARPYRVEMQLHSYVFIRSDISISPGIVYFGSVDPEKSTPVVPVNLNSINSGWRIVDVTSSCPFLSVRLQQPNPQYPNYYSMKVMVKENAPPGPFSEILEVITNDYDQRSRVVPIRVEGRIKQTLSVSPSPLAFNIVEEGKTVEKTLVVQGAEPFQILDITSENRNISATIDNVRKKIQPIKLIYSGNEPGEFNGRVTIITDLEGRMEAAVNFSGKVLEKKTDSVPMKKDGGEADFNSAETSSEKIVPEIENSLNNALIPAPSEAPAVETSKDGVSVPELPAVETPTREVPAAETSEDEASVPELPAVEKSEEKNVKSDDEPVLELDSLVGDETEDEPAEGRDADGENEDAIELLELPAMKDKENAPLPTVEKQADDTDVIPNTLDILEEETDELPENSGKQEESDGKAAEEPEGIKTRNSADIPELKTPALDQKDAGLEETPDILDEEPKEEAETPLLEREVPVENETPGENIESEKSPRENESKGDGGNEVQPDELEELLPEDVSVVPGGEVSNALSVSAQERPVVIGRNLLKSRN